MSVFRRTVLAGAFVSLLSFGTSGAQPAPAAPAAQPAPANPNATGPRPGGRIPDAKHLGPFRPVDVAAFPPRAHSEFVAGPNSGFNGGWLILSRVPAGASGPPLHTHPADQLYFVIKGEMNVQLGDETFTAGPDTLVIIPEGTPHRTWNTSKEEEWHVELIAPPPASENLLKPAEPRRIEDAAGLIRKVQPFQPGRGVQALARRATRSPNVGVNIFELQPGSGGPGTHIHTFDQVFFVLEGELTVEMGLKTYTAGPNTYVIIPAGMVHRQYNAGKTVERHLAMIYGEPPEGQSLDIGVTINGYEDRASRPRPGRPPAAPATAPAAE